MNHYLPQNYNTTAAAIFGRAKEKNVEARRCSPKHFSFPSETTLGDDVIIHKKNTNREMCQRPGLDYKRK